LDAPPASPVTINALDAALLRLSAASNRTLARRIFAIRGDIALPSIEKLSFCYKALSWFVSLIRKILP
jgi:hypothetical protein